MSKDCMSTSEIIETELLSLKMQGIDFEWRIFGSKNLAKVKLKNGKYLFVCPHRKTVRYGTKPAVKYKRFLKFCEKNGFEIAA